MNDHEGFDRWLAGEAKGLKLRPGAAILDRIAAGVQSRIEAPGVFDLLTGWRRAITTSLAAIAAAAIVAGLLLGSPSDTLPIDNLDQLTVASEDYLHALE